MIWRLGMDSSLPVMVAYVLIAAPATQAQVTTMPAVDELDESAFRMGLRERGLTDWLEQYLADVPPINEVDAQLRKREQQLAVAADTKLPNAQRRSAVAEASEILTKLIAEHRHHPARMGWQMELARDQLERHDPESFEALLLYELSGRYRASAQALSSQAVAMLESLRRQIAETWSAMGTLDEQAIERASAGGSLRRLEMLDTQSAMLLAWAKFYRSLSSEGPESQQRSKLSALLAEVTQYYAWTDLPAGHEIQQCGALVMAAVAARLAGDYPAADRYARQIINVLSQLSDRARREQLRRPALVAILEQIRTARDRGRLDEAVRNLEQAYQWAERTRPGDITTALSLALLERSVLARQLGTGKHRPPTRSSEDSPGGEPAGSQPASGMTEVTLLQPTEALRPLRQFADRSATYRDTLYAVLAPAVAKEPLPASPEVFVVQVLMGAAVLDAAAHQPQPASDIIRRLKELIAATQRVLASPPTTRAAAEHGELLFLLGQGCYLTGNRTAAVAALTDLLEKLPDHDRAATADLQAAAIAQEQLRNPDQQDPSPVRSAFIRAARLLQKRRPDSLQAKRLQYFVALALEHNAELQAAAEAYQAVPADDPNALKAGLGRTRCLHNALHQAILARAKSEADLQKLAQAGLQAGREAIMSAAQHPPDPARPDDRCIPAEVTLMVAGLLNHPLIAQPAEALAVLQDFEKRHPDCPGSLGPALRERIVALRQLQRLAEARQVVEQYLATEPEAAGPVMANLLEAMRDEINNAADRGDDSSGSRIAAQAVQLGSKLLEWSQHRPDHVEPQDVLTLRVWWAWSLLKTGRANDALQAYQECEQRVQKWPEVNAAIRLEIQLGLAESLLAIGRATDALPLFAAAWQQSPERSPAWWRALVGNLQCHNRLGSDPNQILQTIRQQRYLAPELGSGQWKRALEVIEATARAHAGPGRQPPNLDRVTDHETQGSTTRTSE